MINSSQQVFLRRAIHLIIAISIILLSGVAAANPADKPLTVTMTGFFMPTINAVNETRDAGLRGYDFRTNTRVLLMGEGTNDGVTYGVGVWLIGDQSNDENADEAGMFISGAWGRLEIGDDDGAADKPALTAPEGFALGGVVGRGPVSTYRDFITATGSAASQPYLTRLRRTYESFDSGDATKVTYFTPRWQGVQLAASYVPDWSGAQGSTLDRDAVSGVLNFGEGYELGAQGRWQLNDWELGLSAGFVAAEAAAGYRDLASWNIGSSVKYGDLLLGASVTWDGKTGLLKTATGTFDNNAYGVTVGGQYTVADMIWGLNYLTAKGEGDSTNPGAIKAEALALGLSYRWQTGLTPFAQNVWFVNDVEGEANDNAGSVFSAGIRVDF